MIDRYGYTIFCDDIRNEPGDKLTFVGCYNAVMFVPPKFPLVLPKFCVHLNVFSPATMPYETVRARCYVPGDRDPIADESIEVPSLQDQRALLASLPKNINAPPFIVVSASLVFQPLEIAEPGMIDVRVLINGGPGELHLGSLKVATAVN
jgi:hypothetical protein